MSERVATTADVRRATRAARGQPPGSLAFSLFWLGWVLAGLGVEITALASGVPGATFSANFRRWITGQSRPAVIPPAAYWAGRVVTAGFLTWLIGHLAAGWWG